MESPSLRIIGRKGRDSQLKGREDILNKVEEDFPILNKEMPINTQEAYRTPRKGTSPLYPLPHNNQNTRYIEERILKAARGKKPSNI